MEPDREPEDPIELAETVQIGPIDYETPAEAIRPAISFVLLGIAIGVALGPGVAISAAIVDAQLINRGQHYAGLGGLLIGMFVGAALCLAAAIVGIVLVKRRGNRRRTSVGLGLIIGCGLQLLGIGLCFAAV